MNEKIMEEKVLIKSEHYDVKKVTVISIAVIAVITLWMALNSIVSGYSEYGKLTFEVIIWRYLNIDNDFRYYIAIFVMLLLGFVSWMMGSYSLTVTDKRVYGQTSFGKRVDLPIDMVSAVGTGLFKSIAIGTSSGRISFEFIKNQDEMHTVLSQLIIGRQPAQTKTIVQESSVPDKGDELRKLKALLDDGIITQEDFDAKKKELLGL